MKKNVTWVLVADAGHARILYNEGHGRGLHRAFDHDFAAPHTTNKEAETDAPGRTFDSGGPGRHFKGKEEDWQEHEEKSFAKDLAHELNQAADQGRFDRVVVVAPDRFLGELRPNLSGRVSDHIHAEAHKDLTHARIDELEQHLADVMPV